MARLGKRERAARREARLAERAAELRVARAGEPARYAMMRFDGTNLHPVSRKWEWDWKADRRIKHGGKWT